VALQLQSRIVNHIMDLFEIEVRTLTPYFYYFTFEMLTFGMIFVAC
jgi:hypothetical protein